MGDCPHKRGDWIKEKGFWLCADCFSKRDGRPTRYGPGVQGADGTWISGAQVIIWQAEIAAADGVTLNDFLRTMARRFMQKTRPHMDRNDAYDMAISVLANLGDAFGDPAYHWSHEGARDLADDEMSYWEQEGEARNG